MALSVNNNIASLNTRRHLGFNNRDLESRLGHLASGLRINEANDDAAGLSISEGFRSQIARQTVGEQLTIGA